MKNKILIIVILSIAASMFNSCNEAELLDKYPQDSANADNFFLNETTARSSVAACFKPMNSDAWFYKRYFVEYMDIMTDDGYSRLNQTWKIELFTWTFDASHVGFMYWYRGFLRVVNNANFAIEGIPTSTDIKFTEAEQKSYIAVAKLMKGFAYLMLTTMYGDVPYFAAFLSDPDLAYIARTPKADVMLALIEDLKYAKEYLPDTWSGADKGLPTKAAGAGMLAKAYLYAKDFPNAEIAAKEALAICDRTGYTMMADYEYMMSQQCQDDNANTEFLFQLNFLKDDVANGNVNEGTVFRGVRDAPGPVKNIYGAGWGVTLPSRNLYDAFEPGDPRRKYSMWAPGNFYGIYQDPKVTVGGVTYTPGDSIFYQKNWSPSNLNTRKLYSPWRGMVTDIVNGYDIPLLRYADLVLIYAEALIENNKIIEGMAQINKVRARPSVGMPALLASSQVDARAKLRHERRIELNMEGIRVFDLLRWGALEETFGTGINAVPILLKLGDNTLLKEQNLTFPKNNLFPIPLDEIDNNPNAIQNPGY